MRRCAPMVLLSACCRARASIIRSCRLAACFLLRPSPATPIAVCSTGSVQRWHMTRTTTMTLGMTPSTIAEATARARRTRVNATNRPYGDNSFEASARRNLTIGVEGRGVVCVRACVVCVSVSVCVCVRESVCGSIERRWRWDGYARRTHRAKVVNLEQQLWQRRWRHPPHQLQQQ